MQQPYMIGIDIGTGSTKALAMDFSCNRLLSCREYYPETADSHERDAAVFFEAFKKSIRHILTSMGEAPAAITLGCHMHSLLAVGADGRPLTPCMLWSDTRSTDIASELRKSESGAGLYLATGTPIHAMSPLCKIKWLKENDPDVFSKTHKFISIKEYIWYQLFGEYQVDHSVASATGLFNIHRLQWDEKALAYIPLSLDKLSSPVSTDYLRSGLNEELAAELQLSPATRFCIGASDGCLAHLGSLCLEPDLASLTIGTSAAVRVGRNQPVQDTEHMLFNYLLGPGDFVCGGAINNGGNVMEWMAEHFYGDDTKEGFENMFGEISAMPAGAEGLVFLPYLNGERAPVWDEKISGAFVGLKTRHTGAHLARAAVEGVCFALAQVLEVIEARSGPVKELRVSGGASGTPVLMRILTDILGRRVVVINHDDASALGACYLGLKALGALSDYRDIPVNDTGFIEPEEKNMLEYKNLFGIYQKLYPALKESMHLLSWITGK